MPEVVMTSGGIQGWFGKLPCAGDFLSQGLPLEVAATIDRWLSTNLLWLEENGNDWTKLYLQAPASGFFIKNACLRTQRGPSDAIGLLMPSVDSVGRLYPFLILQSAKFSVQCSDNLSHSALRSLWSACSQTLEYNLNISQLLDLLGSHIQSDFNLSNVETLTLSSFYEPELVAGPTSWFRLKPESDSSLSIRRIPNLRGWPNGESFLQLFQSLESET